MAACRQCFAPFVRELRALSEGRDPDALEPAVKQKKETEPQKEAADEEQESAHPSEEGDTTEGAG